MRSPTLCKTAVTIIVGFREDSTVVSYKTLFSQTDLSAAKPTETDDNSWSSGLMDMALTDLQTAEIMVPSSLSSPLSSAAVTAATPASGNIIKSKTNNHRRRRGHRNLHPDTSRRCAVCDRSEEKASGHGLSHHYQEQCPDCPKKLACNRRVCPSCAIFFNTQTHELTDPEYAQSVLNARHTELPSASTPAKSQALPVGHDTLVSPTPQPTGTISRLAKGQPCRQGCHACRYIRYDSCLRAGMLPSKISGIEVAELAAWPFASGTELHV